MTILNNVNIVTLTSNYRYREKHVERQGEVSICELDYQIQFSFVLVRLLGSAGMMSAIQRGE